MIYDIAMEKYKYEKCCGRTLITHSSTADTRHASKEKKNSRSSTILISSPIEK
jgi:hypothetical protein